MKHCPKTNTECNNTGCTGEICIVNLPVQTPIAPFPNYGWICPKCGRGLSPYTSSCPCVHIPIQYEFPAVSV